jgi:hypothetical protein
MSENIWRSIWNLKVPNAVKMFMWKVCHNILPTKVNLARRGVNCNSMCPICKREEETIVHMLWSCPAARDVWGCGPIKVQKSGITGDDFFEVFRLMVEQYDNDKLDLIAVIARKIWFRRNVVIHRGLFSHPLQVMRGAIQTQ